MLFSKSDGSDSCTLGSPWRCISFSAGYRARRSDRGGWWAARRKGFSLVELMVVMVILGLLATATTLAVSGYSDTARQTKATTDMSTLVHALESYYAVHGRYPTNAEGLEILTASSKNSKSGFIKKVPKDPWKRPYEYSNPGTKSPFEIICRGADGKEGGEDVNRDISSENLEND